MSKDETLMDLLDLQERYEQLEIEIANYYNQTKANYGIS